MSGNSPKPHPPLAHLPSLHLHHPPALKFDLILTFLLPPTPCTRPLPYHHLLLHKPKLRLPIPLSRAPHHIEPIQHTPPRRNHQIFLVERLTAGVSITAKFFETGGRGFDWEVAEEDVGAGAAADEGGEVGMGLGWGGGDGDRICRNAAGL